MPIYEYQCESCSHRLEKLQKMSDAPLSDCPECGQSTLKKLVSAAAFRLKGGGWYETDFKTKKKTGEGKAESDTADSGGTGDKAGKAAEKSSEKAAAGKSADPA